MANRSNSSETKKRTLSLDPLTDRVLEEMGEIGLYGKNGAEAASYIVRTWLRENRAELGDLGISLRPHSRRRER
jgi:hypothetical protein